MREKVSFRILLPVIAAVLAGTLLVLGRNMRGRPEMDIFAPTANMVCHGINAPASVLTQPYLWLGSWYIDRYNSKPWFVWRALGFDDASWLFLAAVALTWFLVGRELDFSHGLNKKCSTNRNRGSLFSLFLFALGFYLMYIAVFKIWRQPFNNPTGNKIEASLFILWSLILVFRATWPIRMRMSHPS